MASLFQKKSLSVLVDQVARSAGRYAARSLASGLASEARRSARGRSERKGPSKRQGQRLPFLDGATNRSLWYGFQNGFQFVLELASYSYKVPGIVACNLRILRGSKD